MTIRALVTSKTAEGVATALAEVQASDLGEGDVTVAVEYSTLNYKDGLALSGGRIMQSFPMIGGIDLAGTVEASDTPAFKTGDKVILNGWGLSQTHNGGYAQKARVPGDWLIPLPAKFSTKEAMAIGTAGYTAMLCVMALEHAGLTPSKGDVLVTGANGGVGSIAISLLSQLGYRVIASTGRADRSGLPQEPRRSGDHRSRDAVGAGQADRVGEMGWRGGFGRQPYARQCAGADQVPRRGGGVRAGAGAGPAGIGGAVHSAQRYAGRDRLGEHAARGAAGGVGAAGARPRSGQAEIDGDRDRAGGCAGSGGENPQGAGARADGGERQRLRLNCASRAANSRLLCYDPDRAASRRMPPCARPYGAGRTWARI